MKTVEYPLMATTLSKKDLKYIMTPVLYGALGKCGVQRNLPRALVYGTLRSQGLNLHDPWVTQLISHQQVILRHGTRPTIVGQQMRTSAESLVLELGSATSFWDLDYKIYGQLATPNLWLGHTWQALSETQLQMKGPLPTIPTLRAGDSHIMDIFVANNIRGSKLQHCNLCRIYLRATTKSDICTADGKSIDEDAWLGRAPTRPSNYEWPRPGRPSNSMWNTWRESLRSCFLRPYTTSKSLVTPLGLWNDSSTDSWEWWYSPSDTRLFQHSNNSWSVWTPIPTRSTRLRFQPEHTTIDTIPADCCRASVYRRNRNSPQYVLHSHGHHQPPAPPPPIPATFSDTLEQLPDDAKWSIKRCTFTDDGLYLANAIQSGDAIAVSDGSLKDEFGTAAFVLEGLTNLHRILGVNIVPGPIKIGNSYRCELAGLIAIVTMVNALCTHHSITSGKVTIGCDNISSLLVFALSFLPDPQDDSFDLVSALWSLIQESPITWLPVHVEGHQEKTKRFPITRMEHLNIEMDSTAKAYWNHLLIIEQHSMVPPHHKVHGEGWSVWCGDEKLASPSHNTLYGKIQDPITLDHWTRHNRLPPGAITSVDWDACEANMKSLGLYRRRQVTKHASENCGVGKTLMEWKKQSHSRCPRCGLDGEDTTHVLICTAQGATAKWEENMVNLREHLTSVDTQEELQRALMFRLSQFRRQLPLTNQAWSPTTLDLIQDQDTIGWKNLLEGLPSRKWLIVQQRHYKRIGSKRSARRWLSALLKRLNAIAWDQWEHRNGILHHPNHPRQQAAVRLLHREMVQEWSTGPANLPRCDRHHFNITSAELFLKPLSYKKAWLQNVHASRQRQARLVANDLELITLSQQRSRLFQWMMTYFLKFS